MYVTVEVDNGWNLSKMLWGQGKENFEILMKHDWDDEFMSHCEDMGEEWTDCQLNDWLAYEFDDVLKMVGVVSIIDDSRFIKWAWGEQLDDEEITYTLKEIRELFDDDITPEEIENEVTDFVQVHEEANSWVSDWLVWDAEEEKLTIHFDLDMTLERW